MDKVKRIFMIDGHALVFRGYFAFINRPMVNSKGVNTSAIYGFCKSLFELILKERPTHLFVAFDPVEKFSVTNYTRCIRPTGPKRLP
jgi:5'-3' exonuclease